MRRRAWLAFVAIGFACSNFKGAAPDTGDGGEDASVSEAGQAPGDAASDETSAPPFDAQDAPPDATGDSPADFVCTEPWTKKNRTQPGCAARVTTVIEAPILDTSALGIAVTGTKQIGIAYNSKIFADQGELHVARFARPSAIGADGGVGQEVLVIAGTQFDNIGFVADITAGTTGRFHVAYQTSDAEILYSTIDPAGQPTPGETIVTGIGPPSEVALGVLPSGDVRVAYYDPTALTLFSKLRTAANGWEAASMVKNGFEADAGVPGVGHVSQVIDDVGSAHVAFHLARVSGESEARYSQFAGPLWTDPKTLEGIQFIGMAGYSIALGLTGQTRHAAYFVLPIKATGADLHMASWISPNDVPTIEVLEQNLPSDDPPRYRVAMATDAYGLVHLAIVEPQSGGTGVLEYRRQRRVGGQVTWLSDIVDDAVLATDSGTTLVDIALDADTRPHIAYYRGTDGAVCYATRLDRP
jgi:hypothetical protein